MRQRTPRLARAAINQQQIEASGRSPGRRTETKAPSGEKPEAG